MFSVTTDPHPHAPLVAASTGDGAGVDGLLVRTGARGLASTVGGQGAVFQLCGLLDQLAPQYLTTVQRFDLWGEELKYHGSAASYRLSSDGPDRQSGTKDDLVVENGALKASLE